MTCNYLGLGDPLVRETHHPLAHAASGRRDQRAAPDLTRLLSSLKQCLGEESRAQGLYSPPQMLPGTKKPLGYREKRGEIRRPCQGERVTAGVGKEMQRGQSWGKTQTGSSIQRRRLLCQQEWGMQKKVALGAVRRGERERQRAWFPRALHLVRLFTLPARWLQCLGRGWYPFK